MIGHLNIKDITSSTIERFLPCSSHLIAKSNSFDDVNDNDMPRRRSMLLSPSVPVLSDLLHNSDRSHGNRHTIVCRSVERTEIQTEYWRDESMIDSSVTMHTVKWEEIEEDHLKITSCNGTTLFIRYLCDLEARKKNSVCQNINTSEDEDHAIKEKSNALIWCQTIIRICDHVLTQNLQHLGEDEEENDLVHAVLRHNHSKHATPNEDSTLNRRHKSVMVRVKSFHSSRSNSNVV